MRLHVFPDVILVTPNRGIHGPSLRIDRHTSSLSSVAIAENALDLSQAASKFVYGIVGVITLLRGKYLALITESSKVTTICGVEVRKLEHVQFLPFSPNKLHRDLRSRALRRDENRYLRLIDEALRLGNYYFSVSNDHTEHRVRFELTQTLQRTAELYSRHKALSRDQQWKAVDDRFFWNAHLSAPLTTTGMGQWVTPLMSGFVHCERFMINGKSVTYGLISRRSRYRAGKRFAVRGADTKGNVANFVETEQFLLVEDSANRSTSGVQVASFVQTRGSMPFLWQQLVSLKYSPKTEIVSDVKSIQAFELHVDDQIKRYGKQVLVSLVDAKGSQLRLNTKFKELAESWKSSQNGDEQKDRIRFIGWDFHAECRKMKYENIHQLVNMFHPELLQNAYFYAKDSASKGSASSPSSIDAEYPLLVVSTQSGVVRTNCMDCLDRTNVVQSVIARYAVLSQLVHMGVLSQDQEQPQKAFPHADFEQAFRNVWADNADAMSVPYSGTGAQKTDYTRSGVRSATGAARDLSYSVIRYYRNNFCDGTTQDACDLMLGHHHVIPCPASPPMPEETVTEFAQNYRSAFGPQNAREPWVALLALCGKVCAAGAVVFLLLWFLLPLVAALGGAASPEEASFLAAYLLHPSARQLAVVYLLVMPVLAFKVAARRGKQFVDLPRLGRAKEYEMVQRAIDGSASRFAPSTKSKKSD